MWGWWERIGRCVVRGPAWRESGLHLGPGWGLFGLVDPEARKTPKCILGFTIVNTEGISLEKIRWSMIKFKYINTQWCAICLATSQNSLNQEIFKNIHHPILLHSQIQKKSQPATPGIPTNPAMNSLPPLSFSLSLQASKHHPTQNTKS